MEVGHLAIIHTITINFKVENSLQYAQLDKPTYRLCIDKSENPGEI